MILRDLLELVSKEKRRKERLKKAQKFAVGMGVVAAAGVATGILIAPKSGKETREDLKNKAVKAVETIKDSAAHAAEEVSNVIKDVHAKTEDVKKDIKDGYHEITAKNISNEFNEAVK